MADLSMSHEMPGQMDFPEGRHLGASTLVLGTEPCAALGTEQADQSQDLVPFCSSSHTSLVL